MASHRVITLAAACALVASGAAAQAQNTMSPAQVAVACAPPPIIATVPADATRIIGSQDAVARNLFGMPELLVISGGTERGFSSASSISSAGSRGAEDYRDNVPHQVRTAGLGARRRCERHDDDRQRRARLCGYSHRRHSIRSRRRRCGPRHHVGRYHAEPDFASCGRILYGSEGVAAAVSASSC